MKKAEKNIIKKIKKTTPGNREGTLEIIQMLAELAQNPLGSASPDFVTNPHLLTFFKTTTLKEKHFEELRIKIEDYLLNKENDQIADKRWQLDLKLQEYLKIMTIGSKLSGTSLLPMQMTPDFIRDIYLLNDKYLTTLFMQYLPIPRSHVFAGLPLPKKIATREKQTTRGIIKMLANSQHSFSTMQSAAITLQRYIRGAYRAEEEQERLSAPKYHQSTSIKSSRPFPISKTTTLIEVRTLINEANRPYIPQCIDKMLAIRLLKASEQVKLFTTVSHLTAANALKNIFDNALYGRRTLLQFYLPFRQASLSKKDIELGDGNVICLGAYDIDPQSKHGIELIFDVKKLSRSNPCIFYKQRDFRFTLEKVRHVKIGKLALSFSHTSESCSNDRFTYLKLYTDATFEAYQLASVKNPLLVSSNTKLINQILTLNFFRFIDDLDVDEKQKIYAAFSLLNDSQLIIALQHIGKQITDTMEFNIYGAHQIDFSTLVAIKKDESSYTLNLADFIEKANAGDATILQAARENIPELFDSYRFIDYLLTQIVHRHLKLQLEELRTKCTTPEWMPRRTF